MGQYTLRIRLLGSLELAPGDRPAKPGPGDHPGEAGEDARPSVPSSPTAQSLLAYLILRHERAMPRDSLTGVFWPERSDLRARRALSNALWQIRRALGPAADRVVTEGDSVAFLLKAGDWLDVNAFERTAHKSTGTRGDRALTPHGPDALPCLREMSEAAALYRGDFLEGIYDDWVLVERERLRELYLRVLERLILLHKRHGDYKGALTHAQRLAATDPLREAAHRDLMRLCHLLGRPRAALEQFDALHDVLDEELGVEPSAATVALHREIVAALEDVEPAHLPLAASPPPLLSNLSHLPFVGRTSERAALVDALQAALQGDGGIASIEGDAGVGKTRLTQETVAGGRWRGFQAGLGKADPLAASSPYRSLRDALSPLLTPMRMAQLAELMEPVWLSAIIPVLPSISEQLPHLRPLPPLSLREEQQRLWEGLSRCLERLASVAPLLLVLEDLHWADEATLSAIPHLAPRLRSSRTLVILTYRPAEARQRPAVWEALNALDRALPVLRIHLSPFQRCEAVTLVRRALGAGETDAQASAFARRLQEEIGNNALFLVETLKSLLEQGDLDLSPDGGWLLPSDEPPLPIPASVQELIRERVAHLPHPLQAVLELVAVLGEDASFPVICQSSEGAIAALTERLARLSRQGFLAEKGTGYRFEHDLIRDVVYRAIDPQRRRTLHRRAGGALEALHPERVEALALHFDRGGVHDQALTYVLQAGERARAVFEYELALRRYRRALALVSDDPSTRWDVLARQERALDVLSRRDDQADVLREMLRLAEALDDAERRARTRHRRGWLEVLSGKPRQALSHLDQAIALSRTAGDRDVLADCLTSVARAWWRIGDTSRCQVAVEEAQALFRETGNREGQSRALNMLGNLHLGLTGNYARALACFEENRRVDQELGHAYPEACAQGNIGITYALLGQYQSSQEVLAEAYALMDRVGDRHWQAIIRHWQASNFRGLGDLAQAQSAAEEALALCREVGNRNFEIESLSLMGAIAADRDDMEQARIYYQQALDVAQDNQQTMDAAVQRSHLALAYLHLGRSREARRLSQQAVAALEELGERLSHTKDIYFERYQIIAALDGSEAAQPYLELAYQHLMGMADDIADSDLRRSFLKHVAEHRMIVTAYHLGRVPTSLNQRSVRLAHADAPTGRPLRDDEYVEVTWTLTAPEDDEIATRPDRRRHRLLRLLRQATDQSAAPTVADLAAALDVSPRTIKRDLAALRAQGHEAHTRGTRTTPS